MSLRTLPQLTLTTPLPQVIYAEVSHLAALLRLPPAVRKELCQRMVYKVYRDPGFTIIQDGKELHSWQVTASPLARPLAHPIAH